MKSCAILSSLSLLPAVLCLGADGQVHRSDSAGVSIVSSLSAQWGDGEQWSLGAEPALAIGDGQSVEFGSIVDLLELSDGRIVVADAMAGRILVFSSVGDVIGGFGGKGQGPGEFSRITSLQLLESDTLAVFDSGLARLSKFSADGTLLLDLTVRPDGVPGVGALWQASGGRLVLTGAVVVGPGPPGFEDVTYPIIVSETGTQRFRSILNPRGRQLYRDRDGYLLFIPFLRSRNVTVSDHIYLGNGADWTIEAYDLDGLHVQSIRRPEVDLALPSREFARAVARRIANLPADRNVRRRWRTVYSGISAPESSPAYDRLLIDADHYLWVRNYLPPLDEKEVWSIFDPSGAYLGDLSMPPRFEVKRIGTRRLLGVHRDEFDVQTVRIYRLDRNGSV